MLVVSFSVYKGTWHRGDICNNIMLSGSLPVTHSIHPLPLFLDLFYLVNTLDVHIVDLFTKHISFLLSTILPFCLFED